LIVHVARLASMAGQLFVWPKSPAFVPPKTMPVIATLALELFVSVTGIAALVSVTSVPVNEQLSGIPPQLDDNELSMSTGSSVNVPITEVVPVVAVTTTGVALLTVAAVTVNVWEVAPAPTVTGEGNEPTDGALLRPTMIPPAGALPVSVTVPVLDCPEATFAGLKDSILTTGGSTVRPPPAAVPLGSVAVTVTAVLLATGSVVALNVPLLAKPAIMKLAGTVTALMLLLISVTLNPAPGAGPFRFTVATEPTPPVAELGLNVNDDIPAGLTVNVPLALLAASVAVTVTTVCVATPTVVTVNVCDLVPARIVTLAGTVMGDVPAGTTLVVLIVTTMPPACAFWLIVTVPVELVPPVTVARLKLTEVTVIAGTTVTFPVIVVEPVVAITVTPVELATVPAVTTKV
jgi:hypothetical protein